MYVIHYRYTELCHSWYTELTHYRYTEFSLVLCYKTAVNVTANRCLQIGFVLALVPAVIRLS